MTSYKKDRYTTYPGGKNEHRQSQVGSEYHHKVDRRVLDECPYDSRELELIFSRRRSGLESRNDDDNESAGIKAQRQRHVG